ncbi:MAG: hypothetical protein GXP55_15770 [Deltaproteobacteria bacterium]|nr:hypothetical protein [Deltaproteobacteria bacterium]
MASLASFAFGTSIEGLRAARAIFLLIPSLSLLTIAVSGRKSGWLLSARFFSLLTLSLAIYGAAVHTGVYPSSGIARQPSLMVALLASAWAAATLRHGDGKPQV